MVRPLKVVHMAKWDLTNGPGLKVLNRKERWYGGGYCSICGDRSENLVPRAVRFWDCDDGWTMGVLCCYCLDDVRDRGPKPDDYAVLIRSERTDPLRIDIESTFGDLDGAYADDRDRS